jgi:hypothetical protein
MLSPPSVRIIWLLSSIEDWINLQIADNSVPRFLQNNLCSLKLALSAIFGDMQSKRHLQRKFRAYFFARHTEGLYEKLFWLSILVALGIALPAIAAVGTGYTLFGNATYISPGNASNRAVQLVSDANTGVYSGIDYAVSAGLTINDLNTLSTDYNFTAASCALGSPRFGIVLASNPDAAIFVYIGLPPNYTGCAPGWTNTGNLLTPASLVDTSQLPGGSFYDTWGAAQLRYSGQIVTDIFIVSDNGPGTGGPGSQTVDIDNTNVNGTTFTYEPSSKDDCKDGGWQSFTFAPGPFKNQGQCVSYFAKQQH